MKLLIIALAAVGALAQNTTDDCTQYSSDCNTCNYASASAKRPNCGWCQHPVKTNST